MMVAMPPLWRWPLFARLSLCLLILVPFVYRPEGEMTLLWPLPEQGENVYLIDLSGPAGYQVNFVQNTLGAMAQWFKTLARKDRVPGSILCSSKKFKI